MLSFDLQRMDAHRDHEPDAVALVEAGILPASEGGILPPGWKPGLTGSQGWLPPRVRFMASGLACLIMAGALASCSHTAPPPEKAPVSSAAANVSAAATPLSAAPSTNQSGPQVYFVKGIIEEIKPGRKVAIIKHEKIPGYMEAMTMPFEVKDPKELALVKTGDKVMFRMLVADKEGWIDRVTVLESSSMGKPPTRPTTRLVRSVDPLEIGNVVPDYPFMNELGQAVSLAQFRGKAVALTFIFTRCPFPNFCPRMSGNFAEAHQTLKSSPNAPANWHLLSLSFDAEYDTPQVLRNYARAYNYDPRHWSWLTGALIDIDAITEQLGLVFSRELGTFNFNHTLRTAVIDTRGRLQHVFVGNEWKPAELVEQLLKAAAVPPEGKAKP